MDSRALGPVNTLCCAMDWVPLLVPGNTVAGHGVQPVTQWASALYLHHLRTEIKASPPALGL